MFQGTSQISPVLHQPDEDLKAHKNPLPPWSGPGVFYVQDRYLLEYDEISPKTKMGAMEKLPWIEDVSPMKTWWFSSGMLVYRRLSSTKTVPSSSLKNKWLEKMFWVMRLWWGYVTSCRSFGGRNPAPSGDTPPENYHDNGQATIWRCIFDWEWGFSNVMLVFRGVHATLSKNELSFISTGLEGLLHQLNSRCFWKENTCISSVDALWFNRLRLLGHHLRRLRELNRLVQKQIGKILLSDDENMFLCDDIHPNMICLV